MPTLVPAAARALAVFEVFAREKRELSNTEIARYLDLPESSCSDLVNTLIDIGYIGRSHRSRRLYPTGRLFGVASEIDRNDMTSAMLNEACETVRNRTGESAVCGVLNKHIVTVVAFSAGQQALRYTRARGDRLSVHVSAMGKAILARMPQDDVERELGTKRFEKVASATLTDPAELAQQIAAFRKKGWVYLENEGSEGLATLAIAGPVNGEIFALCVAGALPRIRAQQTAYLEVLREVGAGIFDTEETPLLVSPEQRPKASKSKA